MKLKLILFSAAICVLLFQNCSDSTHTQGNFSSLGESGKKFAFADSYHPLLIQKCQSCHSAGGTKRDVPLGDANLETAFSGFSKTTTDAIKLRALNGHGGASTANTADNVSDLDLAYASYVDLLGGKVAPVVTFQYISKPVALPTTACLANPTAANTPVITVNFLDGLANSPATPISGQLIIGACRYTTATAQTAYILVAPRASANALPLQVGKIFVQINSRYIPVATAYSLLDVSVLATVKNQIMSTTNMIVPSAFGPADKIEFGFDILSN
jgi:hypothetical protein